ncbi:MAG: hypothetical protein K0B02_02425 [DPANN group archaeon]|nr:hypothetical protein [DPANN group archaeon]
MDKKFWENEYKNTTHDFEKNIKNTSPVVIGFNTNIDKIKHIDSKFLDFLDLKSFNTPKNTKSTINSLNDFKNGLIFSMKTGKAAEWVINDKKTYDYLKNNTKFDNSQIGGQVGIIANYLKHIGLKTVIVYNPSLSKEEAKYYEPSVKIPIIENDKLTFKTPKSIDSQNETKMNLIYEFKKDMQINTKNESFKTPRQNRFIVSHRPKKNPPCFDKKIEPHFKELFKNVKRIFLSGANIEPTQKTNYYDTLKKQIISITNLDKDIKIHYEFTSEENPIIIKNIIDKILKHTDSLGCNERELCILLENINKKNIAKYIKEMNYSSPSLISGAMAVAKKLNMKRIHVHNLNYFLCITSKDYGIPPKEIRTALLYSAEAVITRSIKQSLNNINDIEINLKHEISEKGLNEIKNASMFLGKDMSEGYVELEDYNINMIPTKLAEHIKTTVGLGDIVSSTAFFGDIVKTK